MLWQQLFNGILLGVTYALVALGFNLVVGAMDKLNLALGEASMVSAMAAVVAMVSLELHFMASLALAMAIGCFIAVATYVLCFHLVDRRFFAAPILSSLGLGLVMASAVTRIWGSNHRRVPDVFPGVRFDLGPVAVSGSQLVILGVAGLLTACLYWFLERTIWGTAIRGVSDDATTSALLGVPVDRIIVLTFALSGLLAGCAGLLSGLAFHTVSPFDGFTITLTALMIIVVGGLGNITGGAVAAVLIGVIQTLTVSYLSATLREFIVFILVGITILARPQGLFSTNNGVMDRV